MDCEMVSSSLSPTSNDTGVSSSNNIDHNCDVRVYDDEHDSLWSVEDDSLFSPIGLMNHSAGKGKSVFVTWSENYLLNFVFKTSSRSQKNTLTKVRLSMPVNALSGNPEEIVDILILESNTLLLMKSGHVYYFSSVKSIHNVNWLTHVYSITSCPQKQFSCIRFFDDIELQTKQMLLEVYLDIPRLGTCPDIKDVLRRRYDISFDIQNLFNCDWRNERYILLSFITDHKNIEFLKSLADIGNLTRPKDENLKLEHNQEVHIFTVSGNIFILVGASQSDKHPSHTENIDCTIQLINTYTAPIESVEIDFRNSLLIVLLQSGHMDIWYKSSQILRHLKHEISYFTHYDYNPSNNTYYFTKPEEVTKLRIIYSYERGGNECMVREIHKAVCGMVACTWVENLDQLITLSINNIFYRICFDETTSDNNKKTNMEYENLNVLYALSTKKMNELLCRAQIVKKLLEQPSILHEAVEHEWQKQQLLSLGFKRKLWKKIIKCRLEYHLDMPAAQYFAEDVQILRTSFDQDAKDSDQNTIYSLINFMLAKKDEIFLSIIQTSAWQIQISANGKCLLLPIPIDMICKNLCFIIKFSMRNRKTLPKFSVNLLTFIKHSSVYLCINFDVDIITNGKTYHNMFSNGVNKMSIIHSNKYDVEYMIMKYNNSSKSKEHHYEFTAAPEQKLLFQISKQELLTLLMIFHIKYENVLNVYTNLHFLGRHPLHLNYDEKQQLLSIKSYNPEALFYIKIILMYALKCGENVNIDLTESKKDLSIMQYQCDIEHLYGSLVSPEYVDGSLCNTSLQLESLLKVYSRLRCEFNEIVR